MLQVFLSLAMSSTRRRLTNQRGMTLTELIITIAIVTAVSGALMVMVQSFYRNSAYLLEETSALGSAQRGLNSSIKSLREATYGDDGSYPIASAGTSTVTFYSDTDTDPSVEKVHIYLLNSTVYKVITNATGSPPTYPTSIDSTTTIATDVRNTSATPLFTY